MRPGPTPTLSACERRESVCALVAFLTRAFCSEGITATDLAYVAKNSPMLLALPNGSKGKHHSMQAAATARAGGNAFPIQYVYVSFQASAIRS